MKKEMLNNCKFIFYENNLKSNIEGYHKLGIIYYPLKTNSNIDVLKKINKYLNSDDGYLISNLNHLEILKKLKIELKRICCINVLMNEQQLKYLYDLGIRFFVFDDFDKLKKFSNYADLSKCNITIRINTMEVFKDTICHLGASKTEVDDMLNYLLNKCHKVGLSFYLQTKIKEKNNSLIKMLNFIKNNFKDKKLSYISIGGLKKFETLDDNFLVGFKDLMNLDKLILEPGQYLMGDVENLITQIIRVKSKNNKTIVVINNGIYNGFLDVILYNKKFDLYIKNNNEIIKLSKEKKHNYNREIYICGGSSDSGDIIGSYYIDANYLNLFMVGNEIIVKNTGAYFSDFFINYGNNIDSVIIEEDGKNEI